jgi:hypothetical protein
MNRELTAYLRLQAIVAAAYNFFIVGMIAGLIYHKPDFVLTTPVSIFIDQMLTCLFAFIISLPFSRASLRRDKVGGILPVKTRLARLLAWLFRRPVLLCVSFGFGTALLVFALTAPFMSLLGMTAIPFYLYVALKCVLARRSAL